MQAREAGKQSSSATGLPNSHFYTPTSMALLTLTALEEQLGFEKTARSHQASCFLPVPSPPSLPSFSSPPPCMISVTFITPWLSGYEPLQRSVGGNGGSACCWEHRERRRLRGALAAMQVVRGGREGERGVEREGAGGRGANGPRGDEDVCAREREGRGRGTKHWLDMRAGAL
eukprot:759932-Hanusia_phi.AAC.3